MRCWPRTYINPLPHVLMLTAIVVSVATLGVALALAIKIYNQHGTLDEDDILEQMRELDKGHVLDRMDKPDQMPLFRGQTVSQHLPALLIVIPLISAFVITLAGLLDKRLCFPLTVASLATWPFFAPADFWSGWSQTGPVTYNLGGWPGPIGIVYHLDHLNALVLVVVSGVALLNLLATYQTARQRFSDRLGSFYTLYIPCSPRVSWASWPPATPSTCTCFWKSPL